MFTVNVLGRCGFGAAALEPSSTWKVTGTKLDPKLATAALARLLASPTAQFLVMRGQHDDRSISSIALLCESRSPLKLQQLYC